MADDAFMALMDIAEFCNHVADDGEPVVWDEHLHDRAPEGGHNHCGPCRAFRALWVLRPAVNDGADDAR